MDTVRIGGLNLEFVRLPSAHPRAHAPAMVFLHEGLGSISLWRDFPQRVADATGCEAVVYSRAGYGGSDPAPLPRPMTYLHDEGLDVLPALLAALRLDRPILLGHSDGGSIALIAAGGTDLPLAGVIAMAPHVMLEEAALGAILEAREAYATGATRERFGRHHRNPDAAFYGWNDAWLNPDFHTWNIEACLPNIRCPILAIQGDGDAFGTMAQLDRIAEKARNVQLLKLPDCGHSPHRDQPAAVLEAVVAFAARVAGT